MSTNLILKWDDETARVVHSSMHRPLPVCVLGVRAW